MKVDFCCFLELQQLLHLSDAVTLQHPFQKLKYYIQTMSHSLLKSYSRFQLFKYNIGFIFLAQFGSNPKLHQGPNTELVVGVIVIILAVEL